MGASKTNRTMTTKAIQQRLRKLADPAVAASSARFFKKEHAQDDTFLRLRAATLHALSKEYRELPLTEVETLLQSGVHEERMLALLILVVAFRKASDTARQAIHDFYLGNHQTAPLRSMFRPRLTQISFPSPRSVVVFAPSPPPAGRGTAAPPRRVRQGPASFSAFHRYLIAPHRRPATVLNASWTDEGTSSSDAAHLNTRLMGSIR